MEQEKIARINALARKAKAEGLTPEETAERDVLRKEYIADVKGSLVGQLENTTIVRPDGTRQKVQKKKKYSKGHCMDEPAVPPFLRVRIPNIQKERKADDPQQQDQGHAHRKAPVLCLMAEQLHPGDGPNPAA